MKNNELKFINCANIITLKRNPQYLTPKQMESLKISIKRDGFCAPILVRPLPRNKFEVISGNHRFMAAQEIGLDKVPCVVSRMTKRAAARLAINLNTIHGEPNVELLAPFLAELDVKTLKDIHIEDDMKKILINYDGELAKTLAMLDIPEEIDRDSPSSRNEVCVCPNCGRKHFRQLEKDEE